VDAKDANRFNQILFLDSLPVGESNMAKRQFEDIETYAKAYEPSPSVKYVRIESGSALVECLSEARSRAATEGVLPMLHIECHGSEDGFELADGSFADWAELKQPITDLNIATRLNLMIAVAACTGGALIKAARMSDRAPFWGLIGPTSPLCGGDLEKAFRALYLTLLSTKSPAKAIEAMNESSNPGLFLRTTSQGLFEKGWSGYKKEHCTPEALEIRAKRMQARADQLAIKPLPTIEELKGRLVNHEPTAFERFRRAFFMCDLYPEHSNRFPLQYVP
jgi:hypothetical protein